MNVHAKKYLKSMIWKLRIWISRQKHLNSFYWKLLIINFAPKICIQNPEIDNYKIESYQCKLGIWIFAPKAKKSWIANLHNFAFLFYDFQYFHLQDIETFCLVKTFPPSNSLLCAFVLHNSLVFTSESIVEKN